LARLHELLSLEEVRAIHLRIFNDPESQYLRSGAFGDATPRQIEQRIRNVEGHNLTRILRAVPAFDETNWRQAWSHYMALGAGTHPWPDANHRTAMVTFAEAYYKAFGKLALLQPDDARAMALASKTVRDPARLNRPGKARYYTVEELADPAHPYRMVFKRYEPMLFLTNPPKRT